MARKGLLAEKTRILTRLRSKRLEAHLGKVVNIKAKPRGYREQFVERHQTGNIKKVKSIRLYSVAG